MVKCVVGSKRDVLIFVRLQEMVVPVARVESDEGSDGEGK